jgi:hypothetical protein
MALGGFLAGAIGAGLSSMFGGLGSSIGAGVKNKNQYDYTRRLIQDQENSWKVQADYANDIAIDNWNRQNAYNTPENQRKLYEAAGLNPALLYSGGASGVSGAGSIDATPSASMPGASFNAAGPEIQGDLVSRFLALRDAKATIDLKESQARENDSKVAVNQTVADLNEAKSILTQSQTLSTDVKREIDRFNLDFLEDTRFINIQQAATNLFKTQAATQALIDSAALNREKLKREPLMRAQIQANIENFAGDLSYWVLNRPLHGNAANPAGSLYATSYVAPAQWNNIFSDTSATAQNFLVQIGYNALYNRPISKQVMPTL